MLTAAISLLVVAVLSQFGVQLSAAKIAGVAVVVKIFVVLGTVLVGLRIARKRRLRAAAAAGPAAGDAPAPLPVAVPARDGQPEG